MRLSRRQKIYASVIAGLLVALWLRPSTQAPAAVLPSVAPAASHGIERVSSVRSASLPVMVDRAGQMPQGLFSVDAPKPPEPKPLEIPSMVSAPQIPELHLLGWVLADRVAWVSVSIGEVGYTLQPGEEADAGYRYDGVNDGMAVFTHLADGTKRQYPLSDVQISQ